MKENRLNENIARLRKQAGMTQEELGRALSVSTQAVSRWERGGAPDIALLPDIAAVFGVSLDTLFGLENAETAPVEELITLDLMRTPPEQRIERTYRLAWHMMKVTISSLDTSGGESYFNYMGSNEDVNRKRSSCPEMVPSVIYISHDTGILQASVAQDFHYALIMPEPEDGYAAVMKYSGEYRKFFQVLAKPYRVEMMALLYSFAPEQHFTSALAAQRLHITQGEADEVLEELYQMRLVRKLSAEVPEGQIYIYRRVDDTAIIPFLYFASELMRAQMIFNTVHLRNTPYFKTTLGEGCLSPYWQTRDKLSPKLHLAISRNGTVNVTGK